MICIVIVVNVVDVIIVVVVGVTDVDVDVVVGCGVVIVVVDVINIITIGVIIATKYYILASLVQGRVTACQFKCPIDGLGSVVQATWHYSALIS